MCQNVCISPPAPPFGMLPRDTKMNYTVTKEGPPCVCDAFLMRLHAFEKYILKMQKTKGFLRAPLLASGNRDASPGARVTKGQHFASRSETQYRPFVNLPWGLTCRVPGVQMAMGASPSATQEAGSLVRGRMCYSLLFNRQLYSYL